MSTHYIIESATRGILVAVDDGKPRFKHSISRIDGRAWQFSSEGSARAILMELSPQVVSKCTILTIQDGHVLNGDGVPRFHSSKASRKPRHFLQTAKLPDLNPPKMLSAQDEAILLVVKKYSWYIDHAFDFRKRQITKDLAKAKRTLEEEKPGENPHVREEAAYESLSNMVDHLEHIQREFDQAHEALRAKGIN